MKQNPRTQSPAELFDKSYPVYKFGSLKSFKPDPNHHLAGKGFIRRGAATLLIGPTGLGKSILAEQWAACLACGKDLWDQIKVPKPIRVLYIEAENDQEVLKEDFEGIQKNLKLPEKLLNKNLTILHVPGLPEGQMGPFLEAKVKKYKPDVIFIDPYQAFIGSSDINSTAPFLQWRFQVESVLQKFMIGLVLITHTPKPKARDDWSTRDYAYLAVGTSAISNWSRCVCSLMSYKKEDYRFHLLFSKQAKRTGMVGADGKIVRSLFLEWSEKIDEPYWRLSESQAAPTIVNMKETVKLAAESHPELSQRALGELYSLSASTVNKYYPKKSKGKKK